MTRRTQRIGVSGSIHVPMAVAIALIGAAALGAWGALRHWRHLVEVQLRLDRCAGRTALDLRDTLSRLEKSNLGVRALRFAIPMAATPAAQASLRAKLLALVGEQDLERSRWTARSTLWLALRGCDGARDLPSPLPEPAWERPPPDAIGPQPLRWLEGAPLRLRIELRHPPRAASSEVRSDDEGIEAHVWKARWTAPGPVPGTGGGPGID